MWFLGLVVAGGVEGQFAEQLACRGVDYSDLVVVDQDANSFVFVGAADSDVVHSGVESEGDGSGVVDAVFSDSPVPVGSCWGCFRAGGVGLCRCSPVEGSVRADGVVVVPERVELGLKVLDRLGRGLGSEPFLQGLLESFDFPLGLWVVRSAVLLIDAEQVQLVLERVPAVADAGGENEAVVSEGGGGRPVFADCGAELGEHQLPGHDVVGIDRERFSGVVIEEGEYLDAFS